LQLQPRNFFASKTGIIGVKFTQVILITIFRWYLRAMLLVKAAMALTLFKRPPLVRWHALVGFAIEPAPLFGRFLFGLLFRLALGKLRLALGKLCFSLGDLSLGLGDELLQHLPTVIDIPVQRLPAITPCALCVLDGLEHLGNARREVVLPSYMTAGAFENNCV